MAEQLSALKYCRGTKLSLKMKRVAEQNCQRLKRRLEELESTAESHPPMSTSTSAKTDTDELRGPLKFRPEMLHKLFTELVRARGYITPYNDHNLQWEDDAIWEIIINVVQLPVELSVHEFKLNLMGYYEAYENNNMSSFNITNETLALIRDVFTSQRDSLADYLPSFFRPPPNSALEQYHQGSVTVVSNSGMLKPPQSIPSHPRMMKPLMSIPSSSSANSIYGAFAQGLRDIKGELSDEEYLWAQLHMTKYKGLVALFCDYDRKERIQLVQHGYGEKVTSTIQRVSQSPPPQA